jgi:glycosyltransferase involved in cell wall biosynthesis
MSSALPVVATPTGIATQILNPLALATSEKHIIRAMRMYDDVELANEHGKRNREVIEQGWRWSQRAAQYLEFFDKCLEGKQ